MAHSKWICPGPSRLSKATYPDPAEPPQLPPAQATSIEVVEYVLRGGVLVEVDSTDCDCDDDDYEESSSDEECGHDYQRSSDDDNDPSQNSDNQSIELSDDSNDSDDSDDSDESSDDPMDEDDEDAQQQQEEADGATAPPRRPIAVKAVKLCNKCCQRRGMYEWAILKYSTAKQYNIKVYNEVEEVHEMYESQLYTMNAEHTALRMACQATQAQLQEARARADKAEARAGQAEAKAGGLARENHVLKARLAAAHSSHVANVRAATLRCDSRVSEINAALQRSQQQLAEVIVQNERLREQLQQQQQRHMSQPQPASPSKPQVASFVDLLCGPSPAKPLQGTQQSAGSTDCIQSPQQQACSELLQPMVPQSPTPSTSSGCSSQGPAPVAVLTEPSRHHSSNPSSSADDSRHAIQHTCDESSFDGNDSSDDDSDDDADVEDGSSPAAQCAALERSVGRLQLLLAARERELGEVLEQLGEAREQLQWVVRQQRNCGGGTGTTAAQGQQGVLSQLVLKRQLVDDDEGESSSPYLKRRRLQ